MGDELRTLAEKHAREAFERYRKALDRLWQEPECDIKARPTEAPHD